MAFTIHYTSEGKVQSFLLDVVEVAKVCLFLFNCVKELTEHTLCDQSHSGKNLTEAFHHVLVDFGITDKVCVLFIIPLTMP